MIERSIHFLFCRILAWLMLTLVGTINLYAQDSSRTLEKVVLHAPKKKWAGTQIFAASQLNREDLKQVNSTSVADAAKLFPGTLVKDYGGIGGLKTISVRSLGASHSAVMYDGIAISDMQGGQVDLGKISSANLESVSLYHAQPSDMLVPARAYASAAVMMIRTMSGSEKGSSPVGLSASMRSGSFGFVNPSFFVSCRHSKSFSHRLNMEYQQTDGRYPFRSYDGSGKNVKRLNSDAANARVEYDASISFNDSNQVRIKAYQYYSDRGLPGSVIFFNPSSRQRLTDRDWFTQAVWQNRLSSRASLLISGKYSYTYKRYVDPDFLNSRGRLENRFNEKELYGSAAFTYDALDFMTLSLASDLFQTRLTRSGEFIGDSSNPSRVSWMSNAGVMLRFSNLLIHSNVLFTNIRDQINRTMPANDIQRLTPTVGLQYQPFRNRAFRIRAFYKDIFRAPTFNDLYYTFVGNVNLRPEKVRQLNIGASMEWKGDHVFREWQLMLDAYRNRVTDKIMAVPRLNLFQWSMMNIGKADIQGIDLSMNIRWQQVAGCDISTRFVYTYQKAIDISNPTAPAYKNQLPYTPEHSGSMMAVVSRKAFSFSYQALFSSHRYRPGDQVPENIVQGWATQDIRATWKSNAKSGKQHEIYAECNNLFNQPYELIRFYPMPGFNFRAGYVFNFSK